MPCNGYEAGNAVFSSGSVDRQVPLPDTLITLFEARPEVVRVLAPLPILGPLGPDRSLDVVGRAFLESQ